MYINISCHNDICIKLLGFIYKQSFLALMLYITCVFIPVIRRVKGYTIFVGIYVTGRRKRFRPHKVYILLTRITSRVDLARSVCTNER